MPININPKYILRLMILILVPLSVYAFFFVTGYHYVPVDLMLGECKMDNTSPLSYAERSSPLASNHFEVKGNEVLICYGKPSARNRKIFGGIVPYDSLWRMGANEPTKLYTTADLVIGEVVVPKGRYSLYAIPGKKSWEIFISTSTLHWGNDINEKVRSKEIGSFEVKTEYNPNFVEDLTIEPNSSLTGLIIEWEKTRVRVPIVNLNEGS